MGFSKNTASQKWTVFAFTATSGAGASGLASTITAKISKDWAAATAVADTNPTQVEAGYYNFDLASGETNANVITIIPVSSSTGVEVVGVPGTIHTQPVYFADMGLASDGDVAKVNLVATVTGGALATAVAAIPTTAMRGTDSAALATALAALVTGSMVKADIKAVDTSTGAAEALGVAYGGLIYGTAATGAAGSITLASITTDDMHNGSQVYPYDGTGAGQAPRYIYDSTASTNIALISPNWTITPDDTTKYIIFPAAPAPTATSALPQSTVSGVAMATAVAAIPTTPALATAVAAVATAVSAIPTTMRGTDNAALATAVAVIPTNPALATTVAALPDSIWNEALATHTTAGTAGKKLTDIPTTAMRGTDSAALATAVAAIPTTPALASTAATATAVAAITGYALATAVAAIPTTPALATTLAGLSTGALVKVDVKKMNAATVTGVGTATSKWQGA